jgi:hypothetical protein
MVFAIGCSSSEDEVAPNQPNQPTDPDKYNFDSKELVVEASQVQQLLFETDYAFIGGYTYRFDCQFKHKGRVMLLSMTKPHTYDSAKMVNGMSEIILGVVATDTKLDTLGTLSGVIFDEFQPFTITVDVIKGTPEADDFRGLEKITVKVNSGVPFWVRIATHLANRKFYAEYYLKYPKEFPELFNERVKVFTGRKMHVSGLVYTN